MLLLLVACADPLLTDTVAAELGERLCTMAHPKASCGRGYRKGWAGGGCQNRDRKDRWMDIGVPYRRQDVDHELVVRVRLKNLHPCRAVVDVLSDDGPHPVLLDNPVAAALVGDALCAQVRR